jgi:radical SAM protein with 4Fe4S-binding SPASM domain
LYHPDFLEIFRFCVERFNQVVVATNGLLMDEDIAEEFAKHTNVVVQISLDGSTPESHDERWGIKGAFKKAVQAFRLSVFHGIPRRAMITVGKDNIDEIEDIIQLLCELGIRRIHCNFVRRGDEGSNISPHEPLKWMQKVDELTSGTYSGIMTILYERKRTEYSRTCGAGTTMLTMGPKGNVRACTYLPEEYMTGGNLFETEDFSTVFKSPMSERLKTLEPPGGDTCKDCEFLEHCKDCFCNGILMYEDIREKCTWGTNNKLEEWINFPS